jgi:hypothetical protein
VRGGNGIVLVISNLWTTNNMSPHDTNFVTSVDIDHFGRNRCLEATVAGKVCVIYILDGVVGGGSPNTNELAIVLERL